MPEEALQEKTVHEEALQEEAVQKEALQRILQKGPAGIYCAWRR